MAVGVVLLSLHRSTLRLSADPGRRGAGAVGPELAVAGAGAGWGKGAGAGPVREALGPLPPAGPLRVGPSLTRLAIPAPHLIDTSAVNPPHVSGWPSGLRRQTPTFIPPLHIYFFSVSSTEMYII